MIIALLGSAERAAFAADLQPVSYCHPALQQPRAVMVHFCALGFCSHLEQEQEEKRQEVEDLMGKMASLQAQNKKLLLEKNSFMSNKKILEAEMEATQKTNRSHPFLIFLHRNTCISKQ